MSDQIFLIQGDSQLVEMQESVYDSEALLQELLEKYPDLLAGGQMNDAAPRRWLLIRREMRIPGEEDGSGRWSLDHLFVDQDAIPTLVEVKRSTDTRIRREVVGQMLDYAANAVVYWPTEKVRAEFETRCENEAIDPSDALEESLGVDDADGFWDDFKTNLTAGRIRLVFVADEIPAELKRVIEFLNGQTDPAEVLGVEIKHYAGAGMRTLVPRVLGKTMRTEQRKSVSGDSREPIPREVYVQVFQTAHPGMPSHALSELLAWSDSRGLAIHFYRGKQTTSCIPCFPKSDGSIAYPISIKGRLALAMFQMRHLCYHPPFTEEKTRDQLREQLERLSGWNPRGGMTGLPLIDLKDFQTESDVSTFLGILDWIAQRLLNPDSD